ncbi:protoheme IX farnesyltransferase [Actinomycetes bacterium]|nr:protoheme IX farnesyltransferase [Actinomycetes bacterium]
MKVTYIAPYIALMKLRVVELLLVTTLPSLFLAAQGAPPLVVSIATLIGGTLAAGAANAFNQVIESDLDKLMGRTAKRPMASGQITETQALYFAFGITIVALAIMAIWTTPLATGLTVAAITFYVFIYTIGLKRRTSQNIVWGGIAGCFPVVIGWSAITGDLSATSIWFFLLIFFWTPPHFWALAIKYKDDYAKAGIPMLPVVAPMKNVAAQMWFHTIAMVITSYFVVTTAGLPKWILFLTAVLGIVFIWLMTKLKGDKATIDKAAAAIFHGSITYLSGFSVLLVIGALVI